MDLSLLGNAINLIASLLIHSVWQGVLIGLFYALSMLILAAATPRLRYSVSVMWLGCLAAAPLVTLLILTLGTGTPSAPVFAASLGQGLALPALDVLSPLLVSVWLAGVAVLGLRLIWNWRRADRLTYLGCQPLPPFWQQRLAELALQMGVRRPVAIAESVLVSVPIVTGWLKPVILLPGSALLGLSRRQLELIIAHELAHIRRYDYLVNALLLCVETLFFYHPVVYLIGRGIRRERELCCDDLVVARCGGRVEYVTALTDIETLRSGHVLTEPLSNIAATGGDLVYRVERIVRGRAPASPGLHVVTVFLAVVLLAGAATLAPDPVAPSGQVAGTAAPSAGAVSQPAHAGPAIDRSWPEAVTSALAPHTDSALPATSQMLALLAVPPRVPRATRVQTQAPRPPATRVDAPVASPPARVTGQTAAAARAAAAPPKVAPPSAVQTARQKPAVDHQPAVAKHRRSEPGQPERAGPTRAMISELDLAQPVLETVSDLQRDAHEALAVSQSPYVIVPSTNPANEYVVSDVSEVAREQGGALIKRIEPRYPSRARLRGYTDTVQIEFQVSDTGRVSGITVVSANSRSAFERAVIRAVKKWRYEPLLRDGVPVERTMVETFAFRLTAPNDIVRGVGCKRGNNNTFSCASPGLSRVL